MAPDEIDAFIDAATEAIIDFDDNGSDGDHCDRLIRALGRSPTKAEIVALAKAVSVDPLRYIEPVHFLRAFERLRGDDNEDEDNVLGFRT